MTNDLPTREQIEDALTNRYGTIIGNGMYRSVYRIPDTRWVVKVDFEAGQHNKLEYEAYLAIAPSLAGNNRVRCPEMHLIGQYLIAEYVKGRSGNQRCWGEPSWRDGKAYYDNGCNDLENCPDNGDCWASLTKEISRSVADIHYCNVVVTEDKVVYVIDLGQH